MTTMTDIETRAKKAAEARDKLRELCTALDDGVKALQRNHLPAIRRAVARASEAEAELKALIEAAPELFQKPKTVTIHGLRLGYMKGRGGIQFDDPQRVCDLIRKHLPDQADALIKTIEAPVKTALANLTVAELKRIGCTVVETADEIVIKAVDSAVDRMVSALLAGAVEETV